MRRLLRYLGMLLGLLVPAAACIAGYYYWPHRSLPADARPDKIVVHKAQRELVLLQGETELRRYTISLGTEPIGPKRCQGDRRTPEGQYTIDSKNPHSGYHKALHISYPNAADRAESARLGCAPGGDVMIHGIKNGRGRIGRFQRFHDWTQGCIALTDPEIDELYRLVEVGTRVEILE